MKPAALIGVLLASLAFVACDKHDVGVDIPETDERVDMSFSAINNETRATSSLNKTYQTFLVKTFKTKDNANVSVMDNYKVKYENGVGWYYDRVSYNKPIAGSTEKELVTQELKYWDSEAASYTFAAVSPFPYLEDDEKVAGVAYPGYDATVSIGDDGKISISNVLGNMSWDNSENSRRAPNWMIARTVRTNGTTVTDEDDLLDTNKTSAFTQPNSLTSTVPMNFHHIMAKVDFRVYCESGSITLKQFKVMLPENNEDKFPNKGDYSTTGGWTNTEAVTTSEQNPKCFCDYDYTEYNYTAGELFSVPQGLKDSNGKVTNAVLIASNVEIPQTWESRTLNVTFLSSDDKTYEGTIILNATNHGDIGDNKTGWLQNKHYIYTLCIKAAGSTEVILFSVNSEDWKLEKGNTYEEEENNW